VKKSENKQNHLAQRRKDAEAEKKIKELFVPNLSASASLREIVYFFTPSDARATSTPRDTLSHIVYRQDRPSG
jgi:hypothetical protein